MRITILLLQLLSLAVSAQQSGTLDLSFSSDGIVTTNVPVNRNDYAECMLIQPDGRILVGGMSVGVSGAIALVRYLPNGSLDPTFGSGGVVLTTVDQQAVEEGLMGIALQADGKIVGVGGSYVTGSGLRAVTLRYNADGSLDDTFNGDGIRVDSFGPMGHDVLNAVAIQTDGKVIAVGSSRGPLSQDAIVVRYTTTGNLDASFSDNGYDALDVDVVDDQANAVVLQPDGRILLAGRTEPSVGNTQFMLARYDEDGDLDPSFGTDGVVVSAFSSGSDWAHALALQPDGKVLAGGEVAAGANSNMAVARYDVDGELDLSFGTAGLKIIVIDAVSSAHAIGVLSDGRIAVGGTSNGQFGAAMLQANGPLDLGFSNDGRVTHVQGAMSEGSALAIQSDGRLLIAGNSVMGAPQVDIVLLRYHTGLGVGLAETLHGPEALLVHPNPAVDAFELLYPSAPSSPVSIRLHDAQGRLVHVGASGAIQSMSQRHRFTLDNNIPSGCYLIVVSDVHGMIGSARLIKL